MHSESKEQNLWESVGLMSDEEAAWLKDCKPSLTEAADVKCVVVQDPLPTTGSDHSVKAAHLQVT